jgi:hypothetical protein
MRGLILFSKLMAGFVLAIIFSCNEKRTSEQGKDRAVQAADTAIPKQTDSTVITSKASSSEPAIVQKIRQTLSGKVFQDELSVMNKNDRWFTYEEIDLNNDGKKEIFIGFRGKYYCGTGGCTALVLSHGADVITRFTVTQYPIVVRPALTKGWRDLLIGTASAKPSMHLVKWNGKKYPGNPSTQPAFSLVPSEKSVRVLNFKAYEEQWFMF